jgi:hypothetical protein
MENTQLTVAFTAAGTNAHNAPTLNVLGMPTAVKCPNTWQNMGR